MKKLIVALLLLVPAHQAVAGWGKWENCGVSDFRYSYYYEGNTGNYNLSNIEQLYVTLTNCKERGSAWMTLTVKHPEMGQVKCPDCTFVPPNVMEYSRGLVKQAKETGQTINVTGDIKPSGGMTPVEMSINPPAVRLRPLGKP